MRFALLLILISLAFPCLSQDNNTIVKKRGKYGVKANDKWVVRPRYDSIRPFAENRAAVLKKGKWGFIDENGKMAIKREYYEVSDFQGGLASVQYARDGYWYLISIDNYSFGNRRYDTIIHIDSIAIGQLARGEGYETRYNIWKYPHGFIDDVESVQLYDSLLLIRNSIWSEDKMTGKTKPSALIITTNGREVTPEFFIVDSLFQKQIIITECEKSKQAILTVDGKVSEWYSNIYTMDTEHYKIVKRDKVGVMNTEFQITVPLAFSSVQLAGDNYILGQDSFFILADTTGRQLSIPFEWITYLNEGFCTAKKNWDDTTFLIINPRGEVFPGEYAHVFPFSEGIARVVKLGDFSQYAYINSNGKQITPWYNRTVSYIDDGEPNVFLGIFRFFMAIASLGVTEFMGWFDSKAPPHEVKAHESFPGYNSSFDYFYGSDFHHGLAIISVKRKPSWSEREDNGPTTEYTFVGVVDSSGKQVVKTIYNSISIQDSCFVLNKEGNYSLTTRQEKILIKSGDGIIVPLGDNYFKAQCQGDCAGYFALYRVKGNGGKYITDYGYRDIKPAGDSMFIAKNSRSLFGYLDANGSQIIPCIYYDAKPFINGKAEVYTDYKTHYYINKNGERVK